MSTSLNGRQLAHFRKHGYVVLPAVFDGAEVARMRNEADRILELIVNSSLEYAERLLRGTGQARFQAPVFGALDG